MILWTIKLLGNLRKAIAGRRYPSQLAWAVAFGFLLGVVPHGNLLALAILMVVLSLRLNHAMAALIAVITALMAPRLDPVTHEIGNFVMNQPRFSETARQAWTLPLVPWTDLNNSIVLGSFLMGLALLVPIFVVTYPVFRVFKPKDPEEAESTRVQRKASGKEVLVDGSHRQIAKPHRSQPTTTSAPADIRTVSDTIQTAPLNAANEGSQTTRLDSAHPTAEVAEPTTVETRIDVIRMRAASEKELSNSDADATSSQAEMDEALNYLLRQLRDSQQKDAA